MTNWRRPRSTLMRSGPPAWRRPDGFVIAIYRRRACPPVKAALGWSFEFSSSTEDGRADSGFGSRSPGGREGLVVPRLVRTGWYCRRGSVVYRNKPARRYVCEVMTCSWRARWTAAVLVGCASPEGAGSGGPFGSGEAVETIAVIEACQPLVASRQGAGNLVVLALCGTRSVQS